MAPTLQHSLAQCAQKCRRQRQDFYIKGDKAWSGDPKSALFEILYNKEHNFANFETYLVV